METHFSRKDFLINLYYSTAYTMGSSYSKAKQEKKTNKVSRLVSKIYNKITRCEWNCDILLNPIISYLYFC